MRNVVSVAAFFFSVGAGFFAVGCSQASDGSEDTAAAVQNQTDPSAKHSDRVKACSDQVVAKLSGEGWLAQGHKGEVLTLDTTSMVNVIAEGTACVRAANDERISQIAGAKAAFDAYRPAFADLCRTLPYVGGSLGGSIERLEVADCVRTFEIGLAELVDTYVEHQSSDVPNDVLGECFGHVEGAELVACVKAKANAVMPKLSERARDLAGASVNGNAADLPPPIDVAKLLSANIGVCSALTNGGAAGKASVDSVACQARAAEQAFTMAEPYSRALEDAEDVADIKAPEDNTL